MGWVVQGQLPEELDHLLVDMKPGQVAGPVRAEGGYYLLLLRDRREPATGVGAEAALPPPPPADPNAPVPLERLLIPLPANADQALKTRAIALASNMKSQLRSCADLSNAARGVQGTLYSKLGTVNPKDLNSELRDSLAKTSPGEVVEPFVSAAGVELIMRCDGAPPRPGVAVLPTRAELQQQLSAQQMALCQGLSARSSSRRGGLRHGPVKRPQKKTPPKPSGLSGFLMGLDYRSSGNPKRWS